MSRSARAQGALLVGAFVCALLAVALAALAFDLSRWPDALAAGDVRYRVSPQATDLWTVEQHVPFGIAGKVLAIEDDLDFRRALRALRLSRLEEAALIDPALTLQRQEAQARLESIATGRGDRLRRSRAAALLGVLALARTTVETQDRTALLTSALSNLRLAITLDPTNEDAKYNLELALQRSTGIEFSESAGGRNPAPGGSGAKGAGAGDPGSGY